MYLKYTVSTSIPITFEATSEEDSRFMPVVIDIAHIGQNLNNSVFSREFLEKIAPTLGNIPIVGYVTLDNYNEADFNGHEEKLVIDGNNYDFVYMGKAFGVVPEINNYRFEDKVCADGITRTFLRCDALLWKKFKECTDIFDRDSEKSQSLEFDPNSIQGYFSKDKMFHFTDAKFEAACILGNGVQPAHTGSSIEKFAASGLKEQISEMFSELKTYFETRHFAVDDSQKGGKEVDQVLEMLQKYSLSLDDLQAKEIDHTQFSLEELEGKVKEMFSVKEVEVVEEEVPAPSPAPSQFSLTADQLESELRRELTGVETVTEEHYGEIYSYPRYYYRDHKPEENIVIAMDEKNWYLVGLSYSVAGDSVQVDASTVKRFKVDYVPMELSAEGDGNGAPTVMSVAKYEFILAAKEKHMQAEFSAEKAKVEQELTDLKVQFEQVDTERSQFASKLAEKDATERENAEIDLFDRFADKLSDEEMADIKENKSQFSIEQLEEKLMVVFAKKNLKFSANPDNKPLRYGIPDDEGKVKSDKCYADLIERNRKS